MKKVLCILLCLTLTVLLFAACGENAANAKEHVIYAIDENRKRELINLYKQTPREKRNQPVYVEKYKLTDDKKEQSPEEKLKSLFGDTLKIEE